MDINKFIYWDNFIHSAMAGSQFSTVGWEYRFGLRVTEFLEVGYYHHSQHVLDAIYPCSGYPLIDALEIKINIYNSNQKREALVPWR